MKVLGIEFKKSHAVIAASFILTATLFYPFYSNVQTYSGLSRLNDGAQVCFSRVLQSFTARMIGDASSSYLNQSFLNLTSQCYSDLLQNYQQELAPEFDEIGSKVSRISNDIAWFNQKLETKVIDLSGRGSVGAVLIQNRFKVIEASSDSLASFIEKNKNSLRQSFTTYGVGIFFALLLMVVGIIWEVRSFFNRNTLVQGIERRAEKEVRSKVLTSTRVEKIISDALAVNGFQECQELFTRFSDDMINGHSQGFAVNRVYDEQRAMGQTDEKKAETAPHGLSKLKLSNFTGKIIERLRPQIYAYGVLLDVDVEDNIAVWAKEEGLLQVIFDSFSKCVKSSIQSGEQARVKINAKTLGGTVVLRVLHNGEEFTQNELISVKKRGYENGLSTEVMIIKELMDEFGGKIELSNKKSNMKEIKLVFKRAKTTYATNSKQIREIQKGSKKEIQAQISTQQRPTSVQ